MERKIGEVFECDNIKLRVEEYTQNCEGCYFYENNITCSHYSGDLGKCDLSGRTDRKNVIFIEVENMEERVIKLTLEKAKEFYKKGGEFRELALSAFTEEELTKVELPETWEEFCRQFTKIRGEYYIDTDSSIYGDGDGYRDPLYDKNMLPSKKAAEAHLALMQLHQLRDCYRQGWEPDWGNNHCKYSIISDKKILCVVPSINCSCFLSFQSEEIARLFLKNFRSLIEEAGDLI